MQSKAPIEALIQTNEECIFSSRRSGARDYREASHGHGFGHQDGDTQSEDFSERLLKGSARKSYAPVVDIDWETPVVPDTFFLPPRMVSLYGTPLWAQMTREQQIELSRQGSSTCCRPACGSRTS